ncbi:MAG: glycosyltransferase family A protein [Patescibacteria group bacterium]|jgi:glycosyltransferase involved in cell wall biosynthesis
MTTHEDIAVVIPCYNHANILRRTLEALCRETVKPVEVVVVDDASQDDPGSIVREFEEMLPIRFVRLDSHGGAPKARNEGAGRTTAPLLLFLDADAQLVPEALEEMRNLLEKHPEASFAYSNFLWGAKRFRGRIFDREALRQQNYIHTSSLLRRADFPGFDETLTKFQDWDLWLTMAENGKIGVWIDRDLYRIQPREQGMSKWMPKIAYMIPWQKLGFQPKEVGRYREAEAIVKKKHGI